jgi:hypothetical protein
MPPDSLKYLRDMLDRAKLIQHYIAGRAKTSQRGALKTGQCCDASYTSSVRVHASFC